MDGVDLTDYLRHPSARGDPDAPRLKPIQSRALVNLAMARGLLGYVGVGRGKTLIGLLAACMLPWVERPLMLTRASLVPQLEADRATWSRWFQIHPALSLDSHNMLSTRTGAARFKTLAPDLLLVDEADAFGGKDSNRTRLLFDWVKVHRCSVLFMSGTLIRAAIYDVDHLALLALKDRSPLPATYPTLLALSAAIDPMPLGQVARSPDNYWEVLRLPDRTLAESVQARQAATVGVVMDVEQDPLPALHLHGLGAPTAAVDAVMDRVNSTWTLPPTREGVPGDTLRLAVDMFRALRQLSQGFWYQWRWHDGRQDLAWLLAREAWFRARDSMINRKDPERATVARVTALARDGRWSCPEWDAFQRESARYGPRGQPPVDTYWVTLDVMRAVVDAVRGSGVPQVVWVRHHAVGAALHRLSGWPYFGQGDGAALAQAPATATVICAIRAHGVGANLQRWSRATVVEAWSSGAEAEQNIGRHHRPAALGSVMPDMVWLDVLQHTWVMRRAIVKARREARFVAESTQRGQRLDFATYSGAFDIDNGRPDEFSDLWED